MKKLFIYLILGLQLTACDSVLDLEPEISTTFTNYFKGEKDAAALLYDVNANLLYTLTANTDHEVIGMKVDKIIGQNYNNTRQLIPNLWGYTSWYVYYQVIYGANLILDNAYRFTDIDKERLEYYKRQACFTKGFSYFQLAQEWGDVPIVPNSTDTKAYPRENVLKVLDEAVRNAEIAMELPIFEELVDEHGNPVKSKQYGCKGAACALLAHIHAWKAGLTGNESDWKESEKYCSLIIDGKVGNYQLVASPYEVCREVMKGNSIEGIFEGEYFTGDDKFFQYRPFVATTEMLSYPVVEGELPTSPSTFEIYKTTVKEMYDNEDRRLDAYFYKIDSVYRNPAGEEIPVRKAFLYKWNYPITQFNEWSQQNVYKTQDVNRMVWRLADIILLRAECRARLGMNSAAETDLNRIRERAYGNNSHAYTPAEGDLRYIIFKEREKELLYEDHRYYDVMRNGYWKTELTEVFANMSEETFKKGAQYYPVESNAFFHNDLMRQNEYWLQRGVK